MELVWQSSGAPARKRTRQACQKCRARKKRCYHTGKSASGNRTAGELLIDATSGPDTRASTPGVTRVGEYIPESVLEDLSSVSEASPERLESHPTHSGPALALARHPCEQAAVAAIRARRQSAWYKTYKRRAAAPRLSDSHRSYLQDAGAFLELPKSTTNALLPIYISVLDDLVPLLDGPAVFRDHSNGNSSTSYLVRAICLVTCKTKQAAPFLRLADDGPVLHPLQFASKLLSGLDAAMKADLEPDRAVKVQILALMHLHNDGMFGMDRSSKYLSQAIHEAWSLSLQWNVVDNKDQEQSDYLWWTLRNLDRLNKPVMAVTPFMVDDTDISIERIKPRKGNYRSQLMSLSLALGDLTAQATKIYKGNRTAVGDDNTPFPSFAEVTSGLDLDRFHRSHREYLEVWYHVAAILSCRYSGPGTVQYNRRLGSADGVLAIFSQEGHADSIPLPLVPYAVSLSTCTIYRALRDGVRDPEAAYKDLRGCCNILDSLCPRWTITKGVAKLANRLCSAPKMLGAQESRGDANQLPQDRSQSKSVTGQIAGEERNVLDESHPRPAPFSDDLGTGSLPLSSQSQIVHDGDCDPFPFEESYQGSLEDGTDGPFYQLDSFFPWMFDYGMSNAT